MIAFKCPGCANSFSVKDQFAGRNTKCPKCGAPLRVPAATGAALSAPVPAPVAKVPPPPPAIVQPALPAKVVPYVLPSRPPLDYKDCPFCGEEVLATALKCKHCGETLDVALRAAEEARRIAEHSSRGGGGAASSTVVIQQVGGGTRSFAGWHIAHLILTILTCGLWLPVWLIHWVIWLSLK
jgi:predicted nucleic acid-binding Zn ribbon protein